MQHDNIKRLRKEERIIKKTKKEKVVLPVENFEYDVLETRKKNVYKEVKVAQWYPIVCDPMDYIVRGILQEARLLEWIAVSFSRGSSQRGD